MTLTTFVLALLLTGSLILPLKALLMNVLMLSAVFGATSKIIFIKELGIGTARSDHRRDTDSGLLVPSLMPLLGQANLWAPAPLRRLYRRVGLTQPGYPLPTGGLLPTVASDREDTRGQTVTRSELEDRFLSFLAKSACRRRGSTPCCPSAGGASS